MPICGAVGCSNRPGVQKELSFFKLPKIITGQGDETRKLSEERRRLWKAAINRSDITTEEKWERTIVCSNHFVGGKKAYLHDRTSPSWVPTLYLSPQASPAAVNDSANERYIRASGRKRKKETSEAVSSLLSLKKRMIVFKDPTEEDCVSVSASNSEDCVGETSTSTGEGETDCCQSSENLCGTQVEAVRDCGIQTELSADHIEKMDSDLRNRLAESDEREHVCFRDLYCLKFYEKASESASFYTGCPNLQVLKFVFQYIQSHLPENKVLTKEEQYLLCQVKLKMNYLFKDIANHLKVSLSTIQRSFHSTLEVLYVRLQFLIQWPERENLRKTMPMCFRKDFGKKVVVMLNCFEVFTERPSGTQNKVYTYSNYKHHQTIKYLIGVAPQGVVTFLSEGWGGRTSDKHITEKCGMLKNLLPGDVVMVDRGFSIEDSVRFYGAELAIPCFTRGKSQLHPLEVEKTRKIASVRIHVERVIGLVLRKFRIFEGVVPPEFFQLKTGETVPTIDEMVRVACYFTNLCPSVVPFD